MLERSGWLPIAYPRQPGHTRGSLHSSKIAAAASQQVRVGQPQQLPAVSVLSADTHTPVRHTNRANLPTAAACMGSEPAHPSFKHTASSLRYACMLCLPLYTACSHSHKASPTSQASPPVEAMKGRHVGNLLHSACSSPPHKARAVPDADCEQLMAPAPPPRAHDRAHERCEGAIGIHDLLLCCQDCRTHRGKDCCAAQLAPACWGQHQAAGHDKEDTAAGV